MATGTAMAALTTVAWRPWKQWTPDPGFASGSGPELLAASRGDAGALVWWSDYGRELHADCLGLWARCRCGGWAAGIVKGSRDIYTALAFGGPNGTEASVEDVAQATGASESTVRRHLWHLVADGLVTIVRRGGRGRSDRSTYAVRYPEPQLPGPRTWVEAVEERPRIWGHGLELAQIEAQFSAVRSFTSTAPTMQPTRKAG